MYLSKLIDPLMSIKKNLFRCIFGCHLFVGVPDASMLIIFDVGMAYPLFLCKKQALSKLC